MADSIDVTDLAKTARKKLQAVGAIIVVPAMLSFFRSGAGGMFSVVLKRLQLCFLIKRLHYKIVIKICFSNNAPQVSIRRHYSDKALVIMND